MSLLYRISQTYNQPVPRATEVSDCGYLQNRSTMRVCCQLIDNILYIIRRYISSFWQSVYSGSSDLSDQVIWRGGDPLLAGGRHVIYPPVSTKIQRGFE